jgi:tetratricopeptide (TPR) repeat protein
MTTTRSPRIRRRRNQRPSRNLRASILLLLLALAMPAAAQSILERNTDSETAMTTPQVRRAEPPSPTATAQQLEEAGDELRTQKSYADSLDYYHAALVKNPRNAQLHNKAGIAYLQLMRHDEAERQFKRALKMDKNYADAHNNLGVIYYMDRKYRKAIKEYRKAIALKDFSASFYSNLGTALFAAKKYDEASAEYLRALEIDPLVFERQSSAGVAAHLPSPAEKARYAYTIAKIYARRGDNDRCLIYLRKALEEGYPKIQNVYEEEEFASVRQDPRFTELMASKITALPN